MSQRVTNSKAALVDVFFCTAANDLERMTTARRCQAAWENLDAPIRLHILTPEKLAVTRQEFQRERRIYADRKASGVFYFCVDDDCFPQKGCFGTLLAALASHRDFAILSALPENANIAPWTPEKYKAHDDPDVMEHVSVGGIRACRKGCLKEWPPMDGPGYDRIQADALRKMFWKVGYAKKSSMYHAGEGRSTIWQTTRS